MSLATKIGDDGYTDIIGKKRLPKNHPVVECLGTLDELNAFLGDAKAVLNGSRTAKIITGIQKELFTLMGILAGMPVPDGMGTDRLDGMIAQLESKLPPLTSFAVPGANPVSAKLHIARTVCRRVERCFVGLEFDGETKAAVVPYVNRLSDLLFLLAQKEASG